MTDKARRPQQAQQVPAPFTAAARLMVPDAPTVADQMPMPAVHPMGDRGDRDLAVDSPFLSDLGATYTEEGHVTGVHTAATETGTTALVQNPKHGAIGHAAGMVTGDPSRATSDITVGYDYDTGASAESLEAAIHEDFDTVRASGRPQQDIEAPATWAPSDDFSPAKAALSSDVVVAPHGDGNQLELGRPSNLTDYVMRHDTTVALPEEARTNVSVASPPESRTAIPSYYTVDGEPLFVTTGAGMGRQHNDFQGLENGSSLQITVRTDELREIDDEFPGATFEHDEDTGMTTITVDPSTVKQ